MTSRSVQRLDGVMLVFLVITSCRAGPSSIDAGTGSVVDAGADSAADTGAASMDGGGGQDSGPDADASGVRPAEGATYYVDSELGDDAASGRSPDHAWRTAGKVNASSLQPGDRVLFRRDRTWREGLTLPSSGTPDRPIVFAAYGTGPRPVFESWAAIAAEEGFEWRRSQALSDSTEGKAVWYVNWRSCAEDPLDYAYRGATLLQGGGLHRLHQRSLEDLRDRDYRWTSKLPDYGCWTYVFRYDAGNPSDRGARFLAGKRIDETTTADDESDARVANLLDTAGRDHVVIRDLAFRGAWYTSNSREMMPVAVLIRGSTGIRIERSEAAFSVVGVQFDDLDGTPATGNVVERMDVHHAAGSGIYLRGHASDNVIARNHVHHNFAHNGDVAVGDKLAIGCTGDNTESDRRARNRIIENVVYENGDWRNETNGEGLLDSAISIYACAQTTVHRNVILNNDQAAFYFAQNSPGSSFASNVVIGNDARDSHMTRFQKSGESRFANNLIVDNQIEQTRAEPYTDSYSFFVNDGSPGVFFVNNIFVRNEGRSAATDPVRLTSVFHGEHEIDHNIYHDNISLLNGKPAPQFRVSGTVPATGRYLNDSFPTLDEWATSTGYDRTSLD